MAKHYVQRPVGRPELRKLRVLAQAEENRFFTVNRHLVAPYRGRLSRRRRLKDVSRRARTPHRQAPDAVLDRSEDVVDLDRRRSRVRRASSATRRLRRGPAGRLRGPSWSRWPRARPAAWSSRHAWGAHNPAIEKTVEPAPPGSGGGSSRPTSAGARTSASDCMA